MAKTSRPAKPTIPEAQASLLFQLLETEMGGVQVYRTALQCVVDPELFTEWSKYLAETERHVVIARALVEGAGLDPDQETPARVICRHKADGLIQAMREALATGTPDEAQIVAAECVVDAETKDHMNWSLVKALASQTESDLGDRLRAAVDEVEPQEDHHLYHSTGWARELWRKGLGLDAVLPPPEEEADVDSAIEAGEVKADAHPNG